MTTLIAIILSMLLCGQASAANPQKAATETQKAEASGDKDRADIKAWLKVKGEQYAAEAGTLLTKRAMRDNAGAVQSQMRIEEICAEVLAKVTDPKIKADWFSRRATTRSFVTCLRPRYQRLWNAEPVRVIGDPPRMTSYDPRRGSPCARLPARGTRSVPVNVRFPLGCCARLGCRGGPALTRDGRSRPRPVSNVSSGLTPRPFFGPAIPPAFMPECPSPPGIR